MSSIYMTISQKHQHIFVFTNKQYYKQ